MRDRIQLELNVADFHTAKRAEQQRLLALVQRELAAARERQPDWYVWVLKRRDGVHDHGMKRADGSRAACPSYGCDVVRTLG